MFCKGTLGVVFVCLLVLCPAPAMLAEVKLPAILADNMVLQQGCELPVWGWAEPGEMVAVRRVHQNRRPGFPRSPISSVGTSTRSWTRRWG